MCMVLLKREKFVVGSGTNIIILAWIVKELFNIKRLLSWNSSLDVYIYMRIMAIPKPFPYIPGVLSFGKFLVLN